MNNSDIECKDKNEKISTHFNDDNGPYHYICEFPSGFDVNHIMKNNVDNHKNDKNDNVEYIEYSNSNKIDKGDGVEF